MITPIILIFQGVCTFRSIAKFTELHERWIASFILFSAIVSTSDVPFMECCVSASVLISPMTNEANEIRRIRILINLIKMRRQTHSFGCRGLCTLRQASVEYLTKKKRVFTHEAEHKHRDNKNECPSLPPVVRLLVSQSLSPFFSSSKNTRLQGQQLCSFWLSS